MINSELDIDTILSSENLTREDFIELRKRVYSSKGELEKLQEKVQKLTLSISKSRDSQKVKENTLILGICHWISGNIDEAIELLYTLKSRKIASYFLGKCYQEHGDYEKAIECLERSQPSDTEDFEIQMDIAETKRMDGDLQNALKLVKKLSKTHDNEADLHYQWAHCLDNLGEREDAMAHYNHALEIDPTHSSTLFRLAYNYDLKGDDEKAIEYYEKCVRHVPAYINAVINLGILYEDHEDYEKAMYCFETVLKSNPNHEKARRFLKDTRACLKMYYDEDKAKKKDEESEVLNIPISDFELSVRSKNCLERMNIKTLADLTKITETDLLTYKNFGETSLTEVKHILSQKGLRLGQSLEEKKQADKLVDFDASADKEKLSKPISELTLSTRCRKSLEKMKIETIGDLVFKTESELLRRKGFKQTYIDEIKEQLGICGFKVHGGMNNQLNS
ncbi:MAG: DNA-directed RNA polymerase subunit alpha C-terminal domain-containing protein [Candidatus Scalinduaceae bacterium]